MKTYKDIYKGKLEWYYETGIRTFPVIYDTTGKRVSGWDSTLTLDKGKKYHLTIKEGETVVYEGLWTYSRQNTISNDFPSPNEIPPEEWKKYVNKELSVEAYEVIEKEDLSKAIIQSLLDTDLYKLTMMQFAYNNKKRPQIATYALKCRSGEDLTHLEEELREQISLLKKLRFQEEEINYLESLDIFSRDFLEYLKYVNLGRVRFDVSTRNGLEVRVTGTWEEAILVEVPLLAIIQELYWQDKKDYSDGRDLLQKKINLIKESREDIKIIDFGSRRRLSKSWHKEVTKTLKKELTNNLVGTSNVLWAKELGLKPIGTMAHEYFQAWQVLGSSFETSQKEALYAWYKEYGDKLNVALTDILGTGVFLNDCDKDLTLKYKGFRHDSGDPIDWGYRMLAHFHEMGINAKDKTLVFSDGLNIEKALKIHREFKGKVNIVFGIGTNLTNDFDSHKPLSLVMKLVRMNNLPTIKVSDEPSKITCEDEDLKVKALDYIKNVSKYPRINIAVDALIQDNAGKVLVIRRGDKSEEGFGKWALPGGYLDYFESSFEAVKREVKEELGVELFKVDLHSVADSYNRDPRGRIVSIVYKGKAVGEMNPNSEVLEYKYISREDLSELDFAFDHKEIIEGVLND